MASQSENASAGMPMCTHASTHRRSGQTHNSTIICPMGCIKHALNGLIMCGTKNSRVLFRLCYLIERESFRGKYPYFWRYPPFLLTQYGTGRRKLLGYKPARFVQLFRQNTDLWWTDTDRQTQGHSYYQRQHSIVRTNEAKERLSLGYLFTTRNSVLSMAHPSSDHSENFRAFPSWKGRGHCFIYSTNSKLTSHHSLDTSNVAGRKMPMFITKNCTAAARCEQDCEYQLRASVGMPMYDPQKCSFPLKVPTSMGGSGSPCTIWLLWPHDTIFQLVSWLVYPILQGSQS